jgi:putative ABC transport system permease protein
VRASGYNVDYDFIKTFGMDIVWGRDFSREFSTDINQAVLINEKAARDLGVGEEVIGKQLINIARNNRRQTVVGVVRDFHHKSLKLEINPVIFALTRAQIRGFLGVRISPKNVSDTLKHLENIWKEINPDRNFAYYFVDDDFRTKYPEEDKVRQVYLYFGILAIFIACLGLYGLASFTVEQRTKEIGIRKVLGAPVHGIITKLSKEFILLVLIANVLAWPTAYYVMDNWLDGFAYRIDISWWTFALSGLIALMIALLTVSHQSIKSALANPVNALRYE